MSMPGPVRKTTNANIAGQSFSRGVTVRRQSRESDYRSRFLASVALLWLSLSALPATAGEWFEETRPIMGTRIHVELYHEDASEAHDAIAAVLAEMERINQSMSPYLETSELSRLNRDAAKGFVEVSPELYQLLQRSVEFSRVTNGAFDVTFASAGRYYDYRTGVRPDAHTLEQALPAIDYHHIEFAPGYRVRYTHPGVYIDLGGIAKGHAVDRCIAILMARGITQAMVAAGGDSRIIGDRRGKPWTVGVKDPRKPDAMAVLLPLTDTAVSTSGDYERYFEKDGVRYHHILDPTTGDSARELRSVTILGPEATLTDALSTSVFVLGRDKGLALINEHFPGVDAIIIDGAGQLHYSAGLAPLAGG
jgi:thiamine biosynthesis lipoprotein